MCDNPGCADRINSYALVSYIPEPLAGFLNRLRQELVPNCFLRAHITILPPRPACADVESIWSDLQAAAITFSPFDIELSQIEVFPVSDVIYVSVGKGGEQLREMHRAMNIGGVSYTEQFPFHPHVTLAQNLKPDELDELIRVARRRWREFAFKRTFRVDTMTFVQSTRFKTWIDLNSCPLGDPEAHILEDASDREPVDILT